MRKVLLVAIVGIVISLAITSCSAPGVNQEDLKRLLEKQDQALKKLEELTPARLALPNQLLSPDQWSSSFRMLVVVVMAPVAREVLVRLLSRSGWVA